MTEPVVTALGLARGELTRRLHALSQDDWRRPTPCSEWDTRQLVNHVVGVQFRIARLLAGGSKEDYIATREADWLGSDHLAAWAAAVDEFDAALEALDNLDVGIDYRVPLTARQGVQLTACDTTVHTWDVSRAIGFDEQLEDEVAEFARQALEAFLKDPTLAAFFGEPKRGLPSDASAQDRLLLMAGR